MNSPRTTLYKDKKHGKIMGVCAGIADYTGISVFWVRLVTIVLSCTPSAAFVIPAYFVAGIYLNKKPAEHYVDKPEQKYWQRVRQSPERTAREIRAHFRDLDRRLAEVEHYYVSNNQRLSAEIERLR